MKVFRDILYEAKNLTFAITHLPFLHHWTTLTTEIPCWLIDTLTQATSEAKLLKISTIGVKISSARYLHQNDTFELHFIDPKTMRSISLRVRAMGVRATPSLFHPFRLLFPFTSQDYAEMMASRDMEIEFYCIFSQLKIPEEYISFYNRMDRRGN